MNSWIRIVHEACADLDGSKRDLDVSFAASIGLMHVAHVHAAEQQHRHDSHTLELALEPPSTPPSLHRRCTAEITTISTVTVLPFLRR